jgi:hypothetical protein
MRPLIGAPSRANTDGNRREMGESMIQLVEGRHACVDLPVGYTGLTSENVVCRLKRAGAPGWRHKELTPANWQDAGHGLYVLSLEPSDVDATGLLCVVIEVSAEARKIGFAPSLHHFEVVEPRPSQSRPEIPHTTLCGYIVTLDQKGRAKAQVTARVTQFPLILGTAGIANDAVTVETDETGYFELSVATGAAITIQIPALNYTRNIIVPPPPVPGFPVRLFSL